MRHRTGHLFKRGTSFYVRWNVEGKIFSKCLRDEHGNPITTRRAAEEAQQKVMAPFVVADEAAALESIVSKLGGRKEELAKWDEEQHPPLPIAQAWPEFLASPNRPDSGAETLYQYECQFSAFAGWMKAKHPTLLTLRDVTKEIVEEYAGHLNHGRLSPNTYNKHLALLTMIFRVLRHKARLSLNPWEEIQRKRLVTQSRRELTVDELKTVCLSATGELRTLFALGIYTGLRLGDCATLRWGEVDLQRGMIRRIPNKTARRNPKPVLVPIHPSLQTMLAEISAKAKGEYVLPETAALYAYRSDAVTDLVQAHFKKCGIQCWQPGTGPDSKEGKRAVIEVGFHSLRHSFVSLCRMSNAPLSVVESIVGHSSPAMTQHYSHVGEGAARSAVGALPDVTGETKAISLQSAPVDVLQTVCSTLESMTPENWQNVRKSLLKVIAGERDWHNPGSERMTMIYPRK